MKTRYILAMLCAAGVLAAGCNKGPEVVVEDPYITVTPDHVEAAYEGQIFDIQVESNCAWTISKTDAEGTAIDWVKCDRATGKGNAAFRVRVYKNNTAEERRATVTLAYEGAKAFIDVVQALNPDPDKPDIPDIPDPPTPPTPPTGDVVELSFDFTIDPLEGWPTASGYEHVDGGKKCIYPLNGYDYTFILADCDGASQSTLYWVPAKDGDSPKFSLTNQYRYLGLPSLEGYRLTKVVCHNASLYTNTPKIGITSIITEKARHPSAEEFVAGGEPQEWDSAGGGTYTYTLTETDLNTVYYIYTYVKGALASIDLTYEKDGAEPPTPPDPPAEEDLVLGFDFTGEPLEGWPSTDKYTHVDGGIECVYPLGGTDYTFVLADCGGASSARVYWGSQKLLLASFYRYLGLPAVPGYKLVKVACTNVSGNTSAKIQIVKSITSSAVHPDDTEIVDGGSPQTWTENAGAVYTYSLQNTAAGVMYYLYCRATGASISNIELTYKAVNQ